MSFPFGPGSARRVDPAEEAARLAEARKAAEAVTVPRRDLAVLVALARRATGSPAAFPDGVSADEALAVLERYAVA